MGDKEKGNKSGGENRNRMHKHKGSYHVCVNFPRHGLLEVNLIDVAVCRLHSAGKQPFSLQEGEVASGGADWLNTPTPPYCRV